MFAMFLFLYKYAKMCLQDGLKQTEIIDAWTEIHGYQSLMFHPSVYR